MGVGIVFSLLLAASAAPAEAPGVKCVLVVPAHEQPWPDAAERLDLVLKDAQWWYSCQMEAYGYGPKTFSLETDDRGKIVVHVAHLDDTAPPTTDSTGLRSAVIQAAEKEVGNPAQRKGTVMCVFYNGYYRTNAGTDQVLPMGFGTNGRWAHLTAWHYFSINPRGWGDTTPVPKLPEQNPFFPPEATRVLQAFKGDGVKSVAQRTSAGYGAIFHEMGHSFGLHHPSRDKPRLVGDVMDGQFWGTRGNFVASVRNEWCCLSPGDAAILDKNPLFQVRSVGQASTGAPRSVGMRGAQPGWTAP